MRKLTAKELLKLRKKRLDTPTPKVLVPKTTYKRTKTSKEMFDVEDSE